MRNIIFFTLLIAVLFGLASSKLVLKKRIGRIVNVETVALEIEYLGTCVDFETRVAQSFAVTSSVASGCLPIGASPSFTPTDDLIADYFCREFKGRSIIHIVEVYNGVETSPVTSFVISFVPNAPFRTNITPKRLPSCSMTSSVCGASPNVVISSCTAAPVTLKKGFVLNRDRIFLSNQVAINDGCRATDQSCCAYISDDPTSTFCPRQANTDLLSLPRRPSEHQEEEHHGYDDNKRN